MQYLDNVQPQPSLRQQFRGDIGEKNVLENLLLTIWIGFGHYWDKALKSFHQTIKINRKLKKSIYCLSLICNNLHNFFFY